MIVWPPAPAGASTMIARWLILVLVTIGVLGAPLARQTSTAMSRVTLDAPAESDPCCDESCACCVERAAPVAPAAPPCPCHPSSPSAPDRAGSLIFATGAASRVQAERTRPRPVAPWTALVTGQACTPAPAARESLWPPSAPERCARLCLWTT